MKPFIHTPMMIRLILFVCSFVCSLISCLCPSAASFPSKTFSGPFVEAQVDAFNLQLIWSIKGHGGTTVTSTLRFLLRYLHLDEDSARIEATIRSIVARRGPRKKRRLIFPSAKLESTIRAAEDELEGFSLEDTRAFAKIASSLVSR